MRETRSPSMSREDRAEHGMWPGGERDCPLARELDRDRSLVARRIDLDADAHGRARPAIDHDAARALARLSAEQAHPLRLGALARARAHPEPEHRHRRRVRRARRHDPAGAALSVAPWTRFDDLDELDHDAERPLGMEECLSPLGVRVIVADDRVPRRLRALAHPAEARDDERHVVDAGPALREEAVEEPVGAARLEDLEATPVLEAPLRERVGAP